jgi:protein transport protein SEC23
MGFNATFKIKASRELKILGLDGPCVSAGLKGPNVGDSPPIGTGGTQSWKLCHIDHQTTVAGYMEVANIAGQPIKQGTQASAPAL